jgi:uncharacterized C2H2 Zn-finger protein
MVHVKELDSNLKIPVQTRKIEATEYFVRCPKCHEEFKAFTEARAKYLFEAHYRDKHGQES